jgi:hypothetical protein
MRPEGSPVRPGTVLVALSLCLTAACAGDDSPPASAPLPAASASASAPAPAVTTETPAATASPPPGSTTRPPRSRFENDPAVRVLRQHYRGMAIGVNEESMRVADLTASSTKTRLKILPDLFRDEYGDRYPGPIPFTPVAVKKRSATLHDVKICVLADGWLQDAQTGRPTKKRAVQALQAWVIKTGPGWRVDHVYTEPSIDCDGVKISEVVF